jgi:hypothetical protein
VADDAPADPDGSFSLHSALRELLITDTIGVNDEANLNPLPVVPRQGDKARYPTPLSSEVGLRALVWTLVIAFAPLVCDGIFTSVIGRRPFYTVSIFHIGLGLFGVTLAALVRILGHGRGGTLIPFLLLAAIVEVVIALYFGGTFSQQEINRGHLRTDVLRIEASLGSSKGLLVPAVLGQLREDVKSVQASDPDPTPGAYFVLGAFGLFSLFALVRYWNPPTEPERRAEEAADGA